MSDAAQDGGEPVLKGAADLYGGVIVDAESLPSDTTLFSSMLLRSLEDWRSQGKRGIWLKIPVEKVSLVPVAVKEAAFQLHHAEEGYVMLTYWIPDTTCSLPPNASHQVGVGAFVVNSRKEVLVVQERNGPLKGMKVWKMPTGLVHAGEDLAEAAEREVLEETGVVAKFHGVLALRQAHGFAFNKSDLFFVTVLRLEDGGEGQSNSGGELQAQESEIEAVAWLPMEEYAGQEFMRSQALHAQILDTCLGYTEGRVKPMAAANFLAGRNKQRRDLLAWCPAAGEEGQQGAAAGKL